MSQNADLKKAFLVLVLDKNKVIVNFQWDLLYDHFQEN